MFNVKVIENKNLLNSHFFNKAEFLSYQSGFLSKKSVVIGVEDTLGEVLAYIALAQDTDGQWRTPIAGAFGGVVTRKSAPIQAIEILIDRLEPVLSEAGMVKKITIKLPPACFGDESALVANILHRKKWQLSAFDINYHMDIRGVDDFLGALGETKRKIIRRLERANAIFKPLSIDFLEGVYSVIEKNRAAQGYPMTMSFAAIKSLMEHFPESVKIFGVFLEGILVSAAICISITPKYFYVFYWGELPEHRKISPVLLLANGLVEYCVKEGIHVMDIGTSTVDSVPNEGLCSFKSSLGCKLSEKLTYTLVK